MFIRQVIPELLFNDFAPELLFRSTLSSPNMFLTSLEDHMNEGIPPQEATGQFLRLYYTQQEEDCCLRKPAGAVKAVSVSNVCIVGLSSLHCCYGVYSITFSLG